MRIRNFSDHNRRRCESYDGFNHKLESWSPADWMVALVGEIGEACNFMKKLHRIRDGIPGNGPEETEEFLKLAIKKELADAYTYLDLMAQRLGIDMQDAVTDKFDAVSAKIGYGGPRLTEIEESPVESNASVEYWRKDSAAGWDAAERRRLETVALRRRLAAMAESMSRIASESDDTKHT